MKLKDIFIYIIIALCIAGGFTILIKVYFTKKKVNPIHQVQKTSCVDRMETVENTDYAMRETIPYKKPLKVLLSYYNCNSITRGDWVYFQGPSQNIKLIRIVRALPGDRVEFVIDPAHKAWNIRVNGKFIPFRKHYYFFGTSRVEPPVKTYIDSHKNFLQESEYLVFSDIAPGTNDSSIFGVILRKNILGKAVVQ